MARPSPGNTSSLVEGAAELFKYLELVKQEGVSNTGNAHPLQSEWLHIALLSSKKEIQYSSMLPHLVVTYNTSGGVLFLLYSLFV